ncbi:hypothetical protein [Actinoplanes sp. NPDC026670]|uniref:phosphotransferase family protein n=1 Tax=Actinoplanes sp. NPDC026670 TaxID=3154700 RepID=UPI0033CD0CB1
MSVNRITYAELPDSVRSAIEEVTGAPESLEAVHEGLNTAVAVKLHSPKGSYFIKALSTRHRWVWTQEREAEIAPFVRHVAPALHARVVDGGWDVLVFDVPAGHRADYSPGSSDLPHVANLLERIGQTRCPDIPLRRAEQRLQSYVSAEDLAHFAGDSFLHTDLNFANIIVGKDRASIVDWGWATRGAPWLDSAYWVIWLITAGHSPHSAEQWASRVPSWRTAPESGVTAFAQANARMWSEIGGANPDNWTAVLMKASIDWYSFRLAKT